MGKIIAFTNQKGGVGKTTTCVNLAAFLALEGASVLVIDIDPQGNATSGLGAEKGKGVTSIYNVLVGEADIRNESILQSTKIEKLKILASNLDLAGAEVELVSVKSGREFIIKNVLNQIRDRYDYIFIDCPPSLGLLTVNALTASDEVIIPIQCEFFALEGLSQLMNTVRLIKKHLNPELDVQGVVLTLFDGRSNHSQQVANEVKTYFDKKMYITKIPRNIKLAEASSYGLPIILYDRNCAGSRAYYALKEEFKKREK